MKLILTIMTVSATLLAGSASAFYPAGLHKLKDTNECVNCDLIGAYLENADLHGAELQDTIRSAANLKDICLGCALMKGVNVCNTIFPNCSVIYSGC